MNITIKSSAHSSKLETEVLKNQLYVGRYCNEGGIYDQVKYRGYSCIAVAYLDNRPVGSAIIIKDSVRAWQTQNDYIMVYVRKAHRRLGIGSKLLKAIKATYKSHTTRNGLGAPQFNCYHSNVTAFWRTHGMVP